MLETILERKKSVHNTPLMHFETVFHNFILLFC